MKNYHFPGFTI